MSSRRSRRNRVLTVEPLECRALLASVMDAGTTLQIELQQSEKLQIVSHGSSYEFTSTTSTFTDGGVTDAADFAGFAGSSLTLNDLAQYTQIDIFDSAPGASVEFLDSLANDYQHDVNIMLDDGSNSRSVVLNGSSNFGDNNLTAETDGAILMFAGTQLSVHNGNVTLTAANRGDGTAEKRGINIQGATITTTGSGNISLTGTGAFRGTAVSNLDGIGIENNSRIESTSTAADAGTITLVGTGGGGADFETGVWIADSTVSSVNGDILVDGSGGGGFGTNHFGVGTRTATLASTGTGPNAASIVIDGIGGTTTSWGVGVALLDNTTVSAVDGDITVNAAGGFGTGDNNSGLRMEDSVLQSSGTGTEAGQILINAVGGGGTNNSGGASLSAGSEVLTVDGAIVISASAGPDTSEHENGGLFVSGTIRSTGTAPIDITGTAAAGTGYNRGVHIVGDTTVIESNSGPISITGTGGNSTAGNGHGVEIREGAMVQSPFGNIVITGTAGSGDSDNYGVSLQPDTIVRSTGTGLDAATISIVGTGGGGDSWNVGVVVSGATVSSIDGDIDMVAVGGDGSGANNRGINLVGDYHVESTGTGDNAADISIVATGGNGTQFNHAFTLFDDDTASPEISTVDGDISIVGTSGTNLTESSNSAVYVASRITSNGTGGISISGSAISGTSGSGGISVAGSGHIESISAPVSLVGFGAPGTGKFNYGVFVATGGEVVTQTGDISVHGTSRADDSSGVKLNGDPNGGAWIRSAASGNIDVYATAEATNGHNHFQLGFTAKLGAAGATGDISIFSDTVELNEQGHSGQILTLGNVLVAPFTEGSPLQTITLGGSATGRATDLNLTDDELAAITAGSVTFGTPGLSLNQNTILLETVSLQVPVAIHGGTILDEVGTDLQTPSVTFYGIVSPGNPIGILQTPEATLTSGSTLRLQFGGDTAGEGTGFHDQLNVSGPLTITANVDLDPIRLLAWRPQGGEELVIVRRNGGTGMFKDLPEGATLPDFFNATISYQGGDGNDIVLTLPQSISLPKHATLTELGGAGVTIFGADEGGNAGQSVHAAGDVNGDGIDDFLIGGNRANTSGNGRTDAEKRI
ncbi:MAG: integrin alpha [Planctomycetaceae bacterium]